MQGKRHAKKASCKEIQIRDFACYKSVGLPCSDTLSVSFADHAHDLDITLTKLWLMIH